MVYQPKRGKSNVMIVCQPKQEKYNAMLNRSVNLKRSIAYLPKGADDLLN